VARRAALLLLAALLAGCATAPPPSPSPLHVPALSCVGPCDTVADAASNGDTRWEPALAADPTDPLHLVATSEEKWAAPAGDRYSWGLVHVSRDGGRTWATTPLPGGPRSPPGSPLWERGWMDDAVPRFLPDGTLLVAALVFDWEPVVQPGVAAYAASGVDVDVFRSTDGGRTFPSFATASPGPGAEGGAGTPAGGQGVAADVSNDKEWLDVAPDGTAWIVWSQNIQDYPGCSAGLDVCTLLRSTVSRDGGGTWSAPQTIVKAVVSGAIPLTLPDGTRVVAYHLTREQKAVVAVERAGAWDATVVDDSTKFPAIAADGSRLYLAYPRGTHGRDGRQEVALRWSDDLRTWSDALVLATPTSDGRTIPAVAAANGTAYVAYWLPGEASSTFHAAAVAHGRLAGDVALGNHDGDPSETGDYMGIAALPDGSAQAVWTSRQAGTYAVHAGRVALR